LFFFGLIIFRVIHSQPLKNIFIFSLSLFFYIINLSQNISFFLVLLPLLLLLSGVYLLIVFFIGLSGILFRQVNLIFSRFFFLNKIFFIFWTEVVVQDLIFFFVLPIIGFLFILFFFLLLNLGYWLRKKSCFRSLLDKIKDFC